jgi:hypothetical protein
MQRTHCNTARGLQHATRSMRHVTCNPDNNIPQQHRQSSRSSRMIFVPAHMHVGLRIHVCECARDCMCARARTRACVFACVRACLRERRRHSDFGDRVSARARSTFACCCGAVVRPWRLPGATPSACPISYSPVPSEIHTAPAASALTDDREYT